MILNGHERNNPAWKNECDILQAIYWKDRCILAEYLLKHVFTDQEIGRACHIHDLEIKVKELQRQITILRETAEYRNIQLKATNLIVSCTGACKGSTIGSKDEVDEETVCEVELIAKRLRTWYVNYQARKARL